MSLENNFFELWDFQSRAFTSKCHPKWLPTNKIAWFPVMFVRIRILIPSLIIRVWWSRIRVESNPHPKVRCSFLVLTNAHNKLQLNPKVGFCHILQLLADTLCSFSIKKADGLKKRTTIMLCMKTFPMYRWSTYRYPIPSLLYTCFRCSSEAARHLWSSIPVCHAFQG